MIRPASILLLLISFVYFLAVADAQDAPATNPPERLKTLVVATTAKSDGDIAIPPITSFTGNLNNKQKQGADAGDLSSWLSKETRLNGLQSKDLQPWHIVVTYDQFDEDGDNVHSGTYEEYWAGEKKYKRVYKSDNFDQTDYATDRGLYRSGEQRWPDRAQLQVRSEVIDPFSYAATLVGFRKTAIERTFSGYHLQCELLEKGSGINNPTEYCFEPDGLVLRYSKGFGWFQTAYNRITQFQGRSLAQDVEVTDAGKPYLRLRVDTIELIPHIEDTDFAPPPTAAGPLGNRVSGVQPVLITTSFPEWPASLRSQHLEITVEIVIGKDGRVVSAHGVSGEPVGYKACEDSARKWVFKPYLILGEPVEVEAKVQCNNN